MSSPREARLRKRLAKERLRLQAAKARVVELEAELKSCQSGRRARDLALAGLGVTALLNVGRSFKKRFDAAEKALKEDKTAEERSEAFIVLLNTIKKESDENADGLERALLKQLREANKGDAAEKLGTTIFRNRGVLLQTLVGAEQANPGILYRTFSAFVQKVGHSGKSVRLQNANAPGESEKGWTAERIERTNEASRVIFETLMDVQPDLIHNLFVTLEEHSKAAPPILHALNELTKQGDRQATLELLSGKLKAGEKSLTTLILITALRTVETLGHTSRERLLRSSAETRGPSIAGDDQVADWMGFASGSSPATVERRILSFNSLVGHNLNERMLEENAEAFRNGLRYNVDIQEGVYNVIIKILEAFPDFSKLVDFIRRVAEIKEGSLGGRALGLFNLVTSVSATLNILTLKGLWRVPKVAPLVLWYLAQAIGDSIGYPDPPAALKERFLLDSERIKSIQAVGLQVGVDLATEGDSLDDWNRSVEEAMLKV